MKEMVFKMNADLLRNTTSDTFIIVGSILYLISFSMTTLRKKTSLNNMNPNNRLLDTRYSSLIKLNSYIIETTKHPAKTRAEIKFIPAIM